MLADPEVGHYKATKFITCTLFTGGRWCGVWKQTSDTTKPTKKTPNKEPQNKKGPQIWSAHSFASLHFQALQRFHTYLLLIWDAHDLHCLHGLLKHVFVLLTRDSNMPIGKEAVFVVRLQQQISLGKNWERSYHGIWFLFFLFFIDNKLSLRSNFWFAYASSCWMNVGSSPI